MTMPTTPRGRDLIEGSFNFARRPGMLARLVAPGFGKILDRIDEALVSGSIAATLPDGTRRELDGRAPGFDCTVELRSWNALVRLASNGSVGWYQAWAAGECWSPDPVPLFALFMQHAARLGDTARANGAGSGHAHPALVSTLGQPATRLPARARTSPRITTWETISMPLGSTRR